MPTPRPLAFALCLALVASLSAPTADAAKKKQSSTKKKVETSLACSDFYAQANADWLKSNVVAGSGMQSALGQLAQRAQSVALGNAAAEFGAYMGELQRTAKIKRNDKVFAAQ